MNGKTLGSMNPRPVKSMGQTQSQQSAMFGNLQAGKPKPVQNNVAISRPQNRVSADARRQENRNQNNSVSQEAYSDSMTNFVKVMKSMVGGFALLDENVMNQNLKMARGEGMTVDDRTISFECADYLFSNLAYIFMGLVLDGNFKQAFLDALGVEMQIDKQPADVKAKARNAMKDPKPYKSNGSIVLGITTFMPAIENELMVKMNNGFKALDKYADEFDNEVAKFTKEQKAEYGFIFSNFMYLIRAFTHNDMFMSYVITVIEKVKSIASKSVK
jgi:hypothetical protein